MTKILKNAIKTLYDHYKNAPRKLKIVCDWDEVIQTHEPYATWLAEQQENKKRNRTFCVPFSDYFEGFWHENLISYSSYGSKIKIDNQGILKAQQEIKTSPNLYQNQPFLTIAEDLLKLIKEDKIETVIFLSAYDKRKFPNGDPRKVLIVENTFANTGCLESIPTNSFHQIDDLWSWKRKTFSIQLQLIGFDSETQGQSKVDWIKKNASDFDIFIDDNSLICKSVVESNRIVEPCSDCMKRYNDADCQKETLNDMSFRCGKCSKTEITVLAPCYPAIENQHDKRVLLVKNEVSELKKEDF